MIFKDRHHPHLGTNGLRIRDVIKGWRWTYIFRDFFTEPSKSKGTVGLNPLPGLPSSRWWIDRGPTFRIHPPRCRVQLKHTIQTSSITANALIDACYIDRRMSEDLISFAVVLLFFTEIPISAAAKMLPIKCIPKVAVGPTRSSHSAFSLTLSLILQGGGGTKP